MTHTKIVYDIMDGLIVCGCTDFDPTLWTGTYEGRNLRLNASMTIQIGNDDFDKWSNSVDAGFSYRGRKSFERDFNAMLKRSTLWV